MSTSAAVGAGCGTTEQLRQLVAAYAARRGWEPGVGATGVLVVEASRVVPGRPGVVDVVADVHGRRVHVPLGLRAVGDEARFLPGAKDPVLGLLDDEDGLAVAFAALADEETATALLEAVVAAGEPAPGAVRLLDPGPASVSVTFADTVCLTVFEHWDDDAERRHWLRAVEALVAAGFTAAPPTLGVWRRHDRVLGAVRGVPRAATPGTAVAVRTVRTVLGAAEEPDDPTGGFAAEAASLGVLCGRLHVALDGAFGRWPGDPAGWSARVTADVRRRHPQLAERADVRRVLDELATLPVPGSVIRGHGDFCLGRVARTSGGWVLVEPGEPGAAPADAAVGGEPLGARRSPMADVADMLWSFGRAAAAGLAEHEREEGVPGLGARSRAEAWERRCRRAFIAAYLGVPGVAALVPRDRAALRTVATAFELERAVRDVTAGEP